MFTTPRLRLCPMAQADLDAFVAYRRDSEIARYQGWTEDFGHTQARALLATMSRAPFGTPGHWVNLAIELVATGAMIGDVALRVDEDGSAAQIGFTLAREAQGHGYATEAVAALLELAPRDVSLFYAITDARNAASIALLRRAGFREAGFHARQTMFKGELCDELRFERAR